MSSPHVAGAAALVRQGRPDWSAVEVKSALQMTATGRSGVSDDGASPWDADEVGHGRVDLTKASLAGIVMHETFENFLAADPSMGGDVRTLNLPSVRDVNCDPDCGWERTVRAGTDAVTAYDVVPFVSGLRQGDPITLNVTPSSILLAERGLLFRDGAEDPVPGVPNSDSATIQISAGDVPPGDNYYGEVRFVPTTGTVPQQHITVAVGVPSNPAR